MRVFSGLAVNCRVLESEFFRASKRVGVFVSCPRLREVHTKEVLRALLSSETRTLGFPAGPEFGP